MTVSQKYLKVSKFEDGIPVEKTKFMKQNKT